MNENTKVKLHRRSLRFSINAFGGESTFFSIVNELQNQPSVLTLLGSGKQAYDLAGATLRWNTCLGATDLAVLLVFLLDHDHSTLTDIGKEEWQLASERLNRVEFELKTKNAEEMTIVFRIFEFFSSDPEERIVEFSEMFLTLFVLSPLISRLTLEQPVDVDSITDVIRERNVQGLQAWLGQHPHTPDDSYTLSDVNPLCFAAEENWTEGAAVLISAGAEINVRNFTNLTPLLYALRNRNFDLARRLLHVGADPLLGEWKMAMYGLHGKIMDEEQYRAFIDDVRNST